jgi:CheY-like chemotaxis protein
MAAVITMEKPVIVAVDDSREMLDILKSLVAGAGYRFFGASNASQCLRLVRDVEPDLILLDIQMPEVDGFELCRQIRAVEAMRNIPVAFVTARRTAQDVYCRGRQRLHHQAFRCQASHGAHRSVGEAEASLTAVKRAAARQGRRAFL